MFAIDKRNVTIIANSKVTVTFKSRSKEVEFEDPDVPEFQAVTVPLSFTVSKPAVFMAIDVNLLISFKKVYLTFIHFFKLHSTQDRIDPSYTRTLGTHCLWCYANYDQVPQIPPSQESGKEDCNMGHCHGRQAGRHLYPQAKERHNSK